MKFERQTFFNLSWRGRGRTLGMRVEELVGFVKELVKKEPAVIKVVH
jgi:hypothetical protein